MVRLRKNNIQSKPIGLDVTYMLDKSRLSIRLVPPYSEERRAAARVFLETAAKETQMREQKERRLNVSGVLRISGVSRSGYLNWKNRLPSEREKRKQTIKERILEIYHDSHQNYGAPKTAPF